MSLMFSVWQVGGTQCQALVLFILTCIFCLIATQPCDLFIFILNDLVGLPR